jgi:hypothetical protein
VTVTIVPDGPEEGLRTSEGGSTVNVVDEKSSFELPVPVSVYAPAGILGTLNEPVRTPPEIPQVGKLTGSPDNVNVQLVSLDENPEP